MPEDFLDLWDTKELSLKFWTIWQEQGEYHSYLADRDLFALWCGISI